MPNRAHSNTDKPLTLKYSQGLIRISCAAVWMLHTSYLGQKLHGLYIPNPMMTLLFHALPTLGVACANIGELYLGIKQFSWAKINSGKSCKPGFIVFLKMFIRAFGCLRLSLVLLCSLPTIQAQVKIRESVSNSVWTRVDFYSSDRDRNQTLHCRCIRESQRRTLSYTQQRWAGGERFLEMLR